MPINVTVINSGKIALPGFIKNILVFTLAALGLNSKVCLFFTLAGTEDPRYRSRYDQHRGQANTEWT